MKEDRALGKTYTDVDQMMEELLSDVQYQANYKIPERLKTP